jgi:hypothetical protein
MGSKENLCSGALKVICPIDYDLECRSYTRNEILLPIGKTAIAFKEMADFIQERCDDDDAHYPLQRGAYLGVHY